MRCFIYMKIFPEVQTKLSKCYIVLEKFMIEQGDKNRFNAINFCKVAINQCQKNIMYNLKQIFFFTQSTVTSSYTTRAT